MLEMCDAGYISQLCGMPLRFYGTELDKPENPVAGDCIMVGEEIEVFDGTQWVEIGCNNSYTSLPYENENYTLVTHCKSCGAPLPNVDSSICTCEYCGTTQRRKIYL